MKQPDENDCEFIYIINFHDKIVGIRTNKPRLYRRPLYRLAAVADA